MHTGNTAWDFLNEVLDAVYPCAYREHNNSSQRDFMGDGLSLCIQGTHLDVLDHPNGMRFIPVHTGNTAPFT